MLGRHETFKHRGEIWTRYPAPPADEAYVVGLDLGQSMDPTALIVLHHRRAPLTTWTVDEKKFTTKQDIEEFFDCVHAERLPLGTSYPDIVEHVRQVLNRPLLRDGCHLVIDESGVGRPVGDMFAQAGLPPIRVSITAGSDSEKKGQNRWSVAKSLLISGVDAALHAGSLRFAKELGEAHALHEELKDFRRHLNAAGRATYQARVGKHDDLVLAVAGAAPAPDSHRALSWSLLTHRPTNAKGAKKMMSDKEFSELQLRAQICPAQCAWPKPDITFSIVGDKPTAKGLHWQRLHEVANEARERVSKAYVQMDEIDCNADLSRDGKYRQRGKTAAQAIADFEASKTLARAREAVERAVAKHNIKPEARDATLKAMKEAEAGWQKAIDKIAERASLARPWTHKPAAIGGWLA